MTLFKDIPGQALLKKQLIRSSSEGRVSHALLLHGPEGNSGLALAMAFAQYLQCTQPGQDDACGVCASCQKAAKMIHPDIHYIFPVVKGVKKEVADQSPEKSKDPVSDQSLASWREYILALPYPAMRTWMNALNVENKQGTIYKAEAESLLRKMSLKAFESDYKVVIIWLPEKMNATVANKLLKIIEEPPVKTVFLLVAQQTESILPTILSRTQLIRVPRFSDAETAQLLQTFFPEQSDQIHSLVPLADGNIVAAVNLLNEDEQVTFNREQFMAWMRLCYNYKGVDLIDWVTTIGRIGREQQKSFLGYGLHAIRENYLLNNGLDALTRMNTEERQFATRFNQFIHPGNIEYLLGIFSRAMQQIEMNANSRILFLDMSHELYRALRTPNPT